MYVDPLATHTALTGKLRPVSLANARLSTLAFDARWQSSVALLQGICLNAVDRVAKGPLYRLQLVCDQGVFALMVEACDHPTLAMAVSPKSTSLRELTALVLLSDLLQPMVAHGLTGLRALSIESIEPDSDEAVGTDALSEAQFWLSARTPDQREMLVGAIDLPDSVVSCLRPGAGAAARNLRRSLSVAGRVCLTQSRLPLRLLRSLVVGDVILGSCDANDAIDRSARVSWGAADGLRLTAPCLLNEQSLTIQGEFQMSEVQPTESDETRPDQPIDSLAELDIPVHFELETVAVPLADLEAIQPGYVIELAMPVANATIQLVAFGQTIGQAELVAVGDKLGARITKLAARDESGTTH